MKLLHTLFENQTRNAPNHIALIADQKKSLTRNFPIILIKLLTAYYRVILKKIP